MKNIIISLLLFISLIFVCGLSINYLDKVYSNMKDTNSTIRYCINKNDWKEAEKQSIKFSNDWHNFSNMCSIFVSHTLIDDISIEEHKLEELIKCKNKDESLASTSSIEFLLDRIKKLENINLQNVL